MDRRRFWATASEAESAEACHNKGYRLVDPALMRVVAPVADLFAKPQGRRDRQVLRGQGFIVRAAEEEFGCLWGETESDGYSGWIDGASLYAHPPGSPTHRVQAAQSYAKSSPGLKAPGRITPLSMGSELVVLEQSDGWARVAWIGGNSPQDVFVPSIHLKPADRADPDPVAVAERLVGTPYLWGGNSAFGIDCSGLVQLACRACAIACPGDSDQQEAALGRTLPTGTPPQRGDVLFWKGHVAWVADGETLLHANAHHMAVAFEPIRAAIARIEAQGDGPVTRHARLT